MRLCIALLFGVLVAPSLQQTCDPTKCMLPNCRCFEDPKPPGDLPVEDTPQIVVVTVQNNINKETYDYYQPMFEIVNPNGCAVRGTFFVQDDGSDYGIVKNLFDQGHEIGINSVDGTTPADSTAMIQMMKTVKSKLNEVGVDGKSVYGVRLPEIVVGGDDELIGIGNNDLLYDSGCSNVGYSDGGKFLWPYTFDFPPTASCDRGKAPDIPFPGKWELFVADLHGLSDARLPCVVPSACRNVTTKKDAFDVFFNAFEEHYNSGRTPYVMVVDAAWAKNPDFRDGTVEFLQYVRAAFEDNVWIVPGIQALQWVQDPTPIANLTSFAPWSCS